MEILSEHPRCPRQAVCFHCQQYTEKLLKALLTRHGIEAPRTHDLRRLIQLSTPALPDLEQLADRADRLTLSGVEIRYPDNYREVPEAEMRDAIQLAEDIAALVLPGLVRKA